MESFYKEQFGQIFNADILTIQITMMALLILDYLLIFLKIESYLKFSLPLCEIPKRFRKSSISQIMENKNLFTLGSGPLYCYPKNIFNHMWSAIILIGANDSNGINGKVAFTPLKLAFYPVIFLSFYYALGSPWGDQFHKFFNSTFLLSFLSIGTIVCIIMGSWVTLDMLKYKKVSFSSDEISANVGPFKSDLQKTKRRILVGFVLYLPLTVLTVFPLIKIFPGAEIFIGFTYFFCFVGWLGYYQLKLYFTICIKCGNPFFRKGLWHRTFSSKCLHCGLSIKKS